MDADPFLATPFKVKLETGCLDKSLEATNSRRSLSIALFTFVSSVRDNKCLQVAPSYGALERTYRLQQTDTSNRCN